MCHLCLLLLVVFEFLLWVDFKGFSWCITWSSRCMEGKEYFIQNLRKQGNLMIYFMTKLVRDSGSRDLFGTLNMCGCSKEIYWTSTFFKFKRISRFIILNQPPSPHPPTYTHKNPLVGIDDALKSTSSLARGSFNKSWQGRPLLVTRYNSSVSKTRWEWISLLNTSFTFDLFLGKPFTKKWRGFWR